jgi:hypothetical protein
VARPDDPSGPKKARPVPPPEPVAEPEADAPAGASRPDPSRRRPPGTGGSTSRDDPGPPRSDRSAPSRRPSVPGAGGRGAPQRGAPTRGAPRRGGKPAGEDVARQSRRSTPSTPGGARGKPVGADKARARDDAPRRRPAGPSEAPPRPDLPVGDRPHLPKPVLKDLERTLGPGRRTEEVALALSVGSQAIDELAIPIALEMLAWAKHQAPRVAAVREAYGVARYHDDDFAGAATELQAYVRISGRNDQNHVLADCLRALGRPTDKVEEVARALIDDDRAPADRRAEASIVLAAALADDGDVPAGRVVLQAVLAERRERDADHHLRVRSLAADLAVRAGDTEAAIRHLEVLAGAEQDGAYDAVARLDELRGR